MSKRSVFTTVSPLPAGVTRQIVLDFLHDHEEMIDLNPLVKERHPIPAPPHAPADELACQWYSLTDKISYFPGVAGDVTYTCAFNDLPTGLQTHCYAPAGLTIRDKWTVCGSLPGEPAEPLELGLQVPPIGLYLREDVDMRCNVVMTSFVKKTLKRSHAALVERLKIKAEIASTASKRISKTMGSGSADDRSRASPDPNAVTRIAEGYGSSNSIISSPEYLAPSAPPSRPGSAASSSSSSIASTASSPSLYSVQSSQLWPSATSSVGTSPAPSYKSPPATYASGTQGQPPHQQGARSALPEPATPFLCEQQPDWPLKAPQQPDWPLPRPAAPTRPAARPQSLPYFSPYRPSPQHASPPLARGDSHNSNANHIPTPATSSSSTLSDDALWQALGGGRRPSSSSAATNNNSSNNNRLSYHPANGEARRLHPATATATAKAKATAEHQAHPDYPHMSPYDDDNADADADADNNGDVGGGTGVVGLGVVMAPRPASMLPAPLRTRDRAPPALPLLPATTLASVSLGPTLSGPFVAQFE